MKSITISTSKNLESLKLQLNNIPKVEVEEVNSRLVLNINNDKVSIINDVISKLSDILTDYIIANYEQDVVKKLIITGFEDLNDEEVLEVLEIFNSNINNAAELEISNRLYAIKRKNTLNTLLINYFETNNEINVCGFVNFRAKEYKTDLEYIVDKAIDDYLEIRDDKELIQVLKSYVDTSDKKCEKITVAAINDGSYEIFDEKGYNITNRCRRIFNENDFNNSDVSYDDFLISALITLNPKKIVIKNSKIIINTEVTNSIA